MTRSVFAMARPVREQRKRALLTKLRQKPTMPLTAIVLAEVCQILGSRESRRRVLRKLVEFLRDDGHRICAGNVGPGKKRQNVETSKRQDVETSRDEDRASGYWLARSDREWHDYRETRRRAAVFEFVALRKMTEAAQERDGKQGKLFETANAEF